MKITIGSDHRGVNVKSRIRNYLTSHGHDVHDCGTHSEESCDYPDIAHAVAARVAGGQAERGILVCGSGIGVCMAANKTAAVRAALCHDVAAAKLSRQHNDANVLCLSADRLEAKPAALTAIVEAWLDTGFEGGRHQRRVDKIASGASPTCHEQ
jgi:ribose 5-phosphate isomerase B